MLEPRCALRSSRTAASHACALPGSDAPRLTPATPRSAASARASSFNFARLQRKAMIRFRARRRWHRLCRVQPAPCAFRPPACRELPRVAEMSGAAAEEIGIETDDHRCALEVVLHRHVVARGHAQAGGLVHVAARIPLMPRRGGEARENVLNLRGERRRRDRLGQDAEAGAFRRLLRRRQPCASRR